MNNIIQVTPFLYVQSIEEAVDLFVTTLGFDQVVRMDGYAYLEREGAGVRILQARDAHRFDPAKHRYGCYFDVKDVDALYLELKERLDRLPPGHVRDPEDQHYGQRELQVLAPDGQFVVFGQPVKMEQS